MKNRFKRVEKIIIAIAIMNFVFPAKVIIKTASQAIDNPFATVILFMLVKYIAIVLGYSLYDKGKIPVKKLILSLGLALLFLLFELCLYKDVMLFLLANTAWLVIILSHLKECFTHDFHSWFGPLHMNANNGADPNVLTLAAVKDQIKASATQIGYKSASLEGANSRFMGAFGSLQQARARLQEERTVKSIAVLDRCRGIAAEERNKVRDLEIQLRTEMDRKEVLIEQARVLGASTNYLGNCS